MLVRVGAVAAAISFMAAVQPAFAVVAQPIVLTGPGASEIPATSVSFTTSAGQSVPVERDQNGRLVIMFPGSGTQAGTLEVRGISGASVPNRIALPAAAPGQVLHVDIYTRTVTQRPASTPVSLGGAMPGNVFVLGAGLFGVKPPTIGAGVNIGGGERYAAQLSGQMTGPSYTAFYFPRQGAAEGFAFNAGFGSADDRASTSIASGTDTVGFVYDDFASNGATGVAIGASGLDTDIRRELDYIKLGGRYDLPYDWYDDDEAELRPRIGLYFTRIDTEIRAFVDSPTFGTSITQTSRRDIRQDFYALTAGVGFRPMVDEGAYWGAGLDAIAVYSKTDYRSSQVNICTPCALPQRDFTITQRDKENEWSLGAEASLDLGYRFNSGFTVGVNGAAIYIPKLAGVRATQSGDDLFVDNNPTHLTTRSSTALIGTAYLGFGF